MSTSNHTVASNFVAHKDSASGNLTSCKRTYNHGSTQVTVAQCLISYNTPIAYIVEGRLYISEYEYSPTTARHLSHLRGAWWAKYGTCDNLFSMNHVDAAGGERNLASRLSRATTALSNVNAPRIRQHTRNACYAMFVQKVRAAHREITLLPPTAAFPPTARSLHTLQAYLALANSLVVNPTGLSADNRLVITAILALEEK